MLEYPKIKTVKISRRTRLLFDAAMFALLLCALAFRITGTLVHGIAGGAAVLFFVIHMLFNVGWLASVFRGKYGAVRAANGFVDAALLALVSAVTLTGVLMLAADFGVFGVPFEIRQIHSLAGYWLFVLAGVHAGMHADFVFGKTPKTAAVFFAFIAVFGIFAWRERAMTEKLFLGYSFDFASPDTSAALFFAMNFSVFFLAAFVAGTAKHFLTLKRKRR